MFLACTNYCNALLSGSGGWNGILFGFIYFKIFPDELGYVFWIVSLEPTEAGGPYNITVTLVEDSTSITLSNVMFGDVYFCSGQSNMFYTMDAVSDNRLSRLYS